MAIISYRTCQDRYCDNFFQYLCQNDYDTEKFDDEFDQIHNVKKRCNSCVDKVMKAFDNSLEMSSDKEVKISCDKEVHQLFTNNNKPEDVHDSDAIVIDEDNNTIEMVEEN